MPFTKNCIVIAMAVGFLIHQNYIVIVIMQKSISHVSASGGIPAGDKACILWHLGGFIIRFGDPFQKFFTKNKDDIVNKVILGVLHLIFTLVSYIGLKYG